MTTVEALKHRIQQDSYHCSFHKEPVVDNGLKEVQRLIKPILKRGNTSPCIAPYVTKLHSASLQDSLHTVTG